MGRVESGYGPVAVICPSVGKTCGIARYSSYVADALGKSGVPAALLRRSRDLFALDAPRYRTIIVQHEYGLFDSLSPLGTGETTGELLLNLSRYGTLYPEARTAIVMHTVVWQDHVLNALNSQIFSSAIPIFHLNSKGCYELGIP